MLPGTSRVPPVSMQARACTRARRLVVNSKNRTKLRYQMKFRVCVLRQQGRFCRPFVYRQAG